MSALLAELWAWYGLTVAVVAVRMYVFRLFPRVDSLIDSGLTRFDVQDIPEDVVRIFQRNAGRRLPHAIHYSTKPLVTIPPRRMAAMLTSIR